MRDLAVGETPPLSNNIPLLATHSTPSTNAARPNTLTRTRDYQACRRPGVACHDYLLFLPRRVCLSLPFSLQIFPPGTGQRCSSRRNKSRTKRHTVTSIVEHPLSPAGQCNDVYSARKKLTARRAHGLLVDPRFADPSSPFYCAPGRTPAFACSHEIDRVKC